jgi:hypothetical protein
VITQRAFAARHVRPIALASASSAGELREDHSWVSQVSGDARTVMLEDPRQRYFGPVDLQAPVLLEEITRLERRFVMIFDNALRVQKKFVYASLSDLPSPLELLGWADALRARQVASRTTPASAVRHRPTPTSPPGATNTASHRSPARPCLMRARSSQHGSAAKPPAGPGSTSRAPFAYHPRQRARFPQGT